MSEPTTKYSITPEEREMWRKQNIADLLYWADLPFAKKIELVEGMEEVARSIHGGKLPPSPDEHEERTTL
jgi:hypothetical protein